MYDRLPSSVDSSVLDTVLSGELSCKATVCFIVNVSVRSTEKYKARGATRTEKNNFFITYLCLGFSRTIRND